MILPFLIDGPFTYFDMCVELHIFQHFNISINMLADPLDNTTPLHTLPTTQYDTNGTHLHRV